MYKVTIYKNTWYSKCKGELLESFKSNDIKKLIKSATKKEQIYINNGVVDDYRSFTNSYVTINNKNYAICHNKLVYIPVN